MRALTTWIIFSVSVCIAAAAGYYGGKKDGSPQTNQILVTVNYRDMQCTYTQAYEKVIERIEKRSAKGIGK